MWHYIRMISTIVLMANIPLIADVTTNCVVAWYDHVSTDCARARMRTAINLFYAKHDQSQLSDTGKKELCAYYNELRNVLESPLDIMAQAPSLFIRYKKVKSLYMQECPDNLEALAFLECVYSITITSIYKHLLHQKIKQQLVRIKIVKAYWMKQQESPLLHTLTRSPRLWCHKKCPSQYIKDHIAACDALYDEYCAYLGQIMHHLYDFTVDYTVEDWKQWQDAWMQHEKEVISSDVDEQNSIAPLYIRYKKFDDQWQKKMHNALCAHAIPHHIERYWFVYTGLGCGLLLFWHKNSTNARAQKKIQMFKDRVFEAVYDPLEAFWDGISQDTIALDSIHAQQDNVCKERDHYVDQVMTYLQQRNANLANQSAIKARLVKGDLLDLGKDYNEIVGSRWGMFTGALSTDIFRNLGLQVGGLKIWLMDKIYNVHEHVYKNVGPNKFALALARSLPIYAATASAYYALKEIILWGAIPAQGSSIVSILKRVRLYVGDSSYVATNDLYLRCGDFIYCFDQLEKQAQVCDKSIRADILHDCRAVVSCNIPREQKIIFADSLCMCAHYF